MRIIRRPRLPLASTVPPPPPAARRRRPRDYAEWRTLDRWGAVPAWEEAPAGYLLRRAREEAGLTQAELGERLGCSQQAIAQAERWESNPTVSLLRRWARAVDAELVLEMVAGRAPG